MILCAVIIVSRQELIILFEFKSAARVRQDRRPDGTTASPAPRPPVDTIQPPETASPAATAPRPAAPFVHPSRMAHVGGSVTALPPAGGPHAMVNVALSLQPDECQLIQM